MSWRYMLGMVADGTSYAIVGIQSAIDYGGLENVQPAGQQKAKSIFRQLEKTL